MCTKRQTNAAERDGAVMTIPLSNSFEISGMVNPDRASMIHVKRPDSQGHKCAGDTCEREMRALYERSVEIMRVRGCANMDANEDGYKWTWIQVDSEAKWTKMKCSHVDSRLS